MDLSFGRNRARRASVALRLDYPRLVAILSAVQGASRTAQLAARVRVGAAGRPAEGLVAMLDPGCDWILAAAALGGSFHPQAARLRR